MGLLNTRIKRLLFAVSIPIIIYLIGFILKSTAWGIETAAISTAPTFSLGFIAVIILGFLSGVCAIFYSLLTDLYKWIVG